MTNQLKLLLTAQDLHNLKEISLKLKDYVENHLIPLKNTLAGEARRAIVATKHLNTTIGEGEKIIVQIQAILGENGI